MKRFEYRITFVSLSFETNWVAAQNQREAFARIVDNHNTEEIKSIEIRSVEELKDWN